nr:GNAT family N-acetyltransferase [Thalassococcus arenae]
MRWQRTIKGFRDRTASHRARTQVAMVDGAVAGFCMVVADELCRLYVAPPARDAEVAQALVQDAENRVRAAGHRTGWLACAVGNDRAARFHDKAGWQNVGTRPVQLRTLVVRRWAGARAPARKPVQIAASSASPPEISQVPGLSSSCRTLTVPSSTNIA